MGLVSLKDMHFYAYHGVYEEERLIGNNYWIDVEIETNFGKAGMSDELVDTINYETVYLICKHEMKRPRRLLEAVGNAIIASLKFQFPSIQEVRLIIRKQNPPLGGKVGFATIEMDGSFVQKCARCKRGMVCYNDETCWCHTVNVLPQTLMALQKEYRGCLCKNCLNLYSDKLTLPQVE